VLKDGSGCGTRREGKKEKKGGWGRRERSVITELELQI